MAYLHELTEELRAGKKIRRLSWELDTCYIAIDTIGRLFYVGSSNDYKPICAVIGITDLQAVDWEVVQEPLQWIVGRKYKTSGGTILELRDVNLTLTNSTALVFRDKYGDVETRYADGTFSHESSPWDVIELVEE